jgi:hypothetical protein
MSQHDNYNDADLILGLSGHRLHVDGSRANEVLKRLYFESLVYGGSERGTTISRNGFREFFAGRPSAGFLPVFEHLARKIGVEPKVRTWHPAPLGDPLDPGGWLTPDSEVVRMVSQRDRGLIRCGPGIDMAYLIAEIVTSYPRTTFAVCLPSKSMVQEMDHHLARFGSANWGAWRNNGGDLVLRVAVGVFGDFTHELYDIQWRDVAFFPDAMHALHDRAQDVLLATDPHFRIFGCLHPESRPAAADVDLLRGIFGFDEIAIPAHRIVEKPVRTAWMPFTSRPRSNGPASEVESLVHQNRLRNRFIAMRARESLATVGAPTPPSPPIRTVVLVDSVRHALALHESLRPWPVIASETVFSDGLTDRELDILNRPRFAEQLSGLNYIATLDGLLRLPFAPHGNVLIWAGAGSYGPEIPRSLRTYWQSADPEAPEPTTVLVDVDDRSPEVLRKQSRRRSRRYVDNDFLPFSQGVIQGQVANYLVKFR